MVKYRCLECKKECDTYITPNGTPFPGAPQTCRLSFCCGVLVEEIADDRDAAIRTAALAEGRRMGLREAAHELENEEELPGEIWGNPTEEIYRCQGAEIMKAHVVKQLRALAAAEPVDTESSIPDFLCSCCAIAHGWVKDPTRQMTINQAPAFICCVCGKSDVAGADRRDFGVMAGMVAAAREK